MGSSGKRRVHGIAEDVSQEKIEETFTIIDAKEEVEVESAPVKERVESGLSNTSDMVRWNHWKLRPRQKLKMKTHFQTQILSSLPLMRNIQNLWLRKSKWKLSKPTVIRGFLYYVLK